MNYTNPYQSYVNPTVPNYMTPMSQNQTQNNSSMVWVQGESGAKAYPVAPGMSQVLFDSESQVFYIKSADQSGMPQPLRIFSYSECNESDIRKSDIDTSMFITRDEFEDAISDITKSIKKATSGENRRSNNNGKSLIPRTNE